MSGFNQLLDLIGGHEVYSNMSVKMSLDKKSTGLLRQYIPIDYENIDISRFALRTNDFEVTCLGVLLMANENYYDAFEYVIENWYEFYLNIDAFLDDLFVCYLNINCDYANPNFGHTNLTLLMNFFGANDIIGYMNNSNIIYCYEFENIRMLVRRFDDLGKYVVRNYEFFIHTYHDKFDVDLYLKYRNNIVTTMTYKECLELCLIHPSPEPYLFLHEDNRRPKNFYCGEYMNYLGKHIHDPRVIDTFDFPLDDEKFCNMFKTILSSYNTFLKFPNLIKVISYSNSIRPFNFDLLFEVLGSYNLRNGQPHDHILFLALFRDQQIPESVMSSVDKFCTEDILFTSDNSDPNQTKRIQEINTRMMTQFRKNVDRSK